MNIPKSHPVSVLLGIPIDNLDMQEALDLIDQMAEEGRASRTGHQVATANVDFLVKSQGDPELTAILREADLLTADGMPLVWGAKLFGVRAKGRTAGSDLVPLLAERAAQKGRSIFLLGSAPQVAARAAEILCERFPGLKIVGVISPPVTPISQMDPGILVKIKEADPDILLVAFGNPKQEKWIARFGGELRVPVMIGIGGTLDFIAGNTKRAPKWMHGLGLEWVHRVTREPKRLFKRYLVDFFVFNVLFAWQWGVLKLLGLWGGKGSTQALLQPEGKAVLAVAGALRGEEVAPFLDLARQALCKTSRLEIDLGQTTYLDNAALGALFTLRREAKRHNAEVSLGRVSPAVGRILKLFGLEHYFAAKANA